MQYFEFNNGIKMPMLGFGTWDVRGTEGVAIIKNALEVGYRLFDSAHMYANEQMLGKAIQEGQIKREKLFITTKLDYGSNSYAKAKVGIQQSLNRLQVTYLDLVLIHEPYKEAEDMYHALEEAYEQGLIKAIGISNFNEKQYLKLISHCHIIPMVNQVESHIYFTQKELKDVLEANGTYMQSWGSFTEGKKDIFHEPVLMEIAKQYQKTAGQVALRYLLQQHISVIPKTKHKERMEENLNVFDFILTEKEMDAIASLDKKESLFHWYNDSYQWY